MNQKSVRGFTRVGVALACLVLALSAMAALFVETNIWVPSIFNGTESDFQSQTHFLVPMQDSVGENATSANAYYNAIDPTQGKRTFQDWLVNAGFIGNKSQWHSTGKQIIACDLGPANGCDIPAHNPDGSLVYGDNVVNTDSHAIVLNAADLGFVRNQFIRCVPSCKAKNPIVYTYLENYPVNPFADSAHGGSGFPSLTGFPTQAEATAAINSALQRPAGPNADPAICTTGDTKLGCKISRIADVAFEWAPPPGKPTSSTRYGQLYAYVFRDASGLETIASQTPGASPNLATHLLEPYTATDAFAPNLDFLGTKQMPGVCLDCHGGDPKKLTSTGAFPSQGKLDGFRFLPLDVRNLMFTSDSGPELTSRLNEEAQLKEYNLGVMLTIPTKPQLVQGVVRPAHIAEVIQGWYTDSGQPAFNRTTQQDYIPVGWREPVDGGTAPPGSEKLYQQVVSPSCRTCHFNREIDLDFGTVANFDSHKGDILELALQPLCDSGIPPKGKRPMPLAHLTYQRFWETNSKSITLPSGQPPLTLSNTADQVAQHFGYASAAAYCASGGN